MTTREQRNRLLAMCDPNVTELLGERRELFAETEQLKKERNMQLVNLRIIVGNGVPENPYDKETQWLMWQMWSIVHGQHATQQGTATDRTQPIRF